MNSNTNKKIAIWHRMLIGGFSTAIIVVSMAAGVFNSQNVAARSNTSVRKINSDQAAIDRAIVPGTITTGKDKPGNNGPKAGASSVEKAPQTESGNTLTVPQDEYTPIQFVNSDGLPITIKEAKMKISDLGEFGTKEPNGSVKHTFKVLFQIKISNPSDQKLTGAIIQLNSRESNRRIFIIENPKLNVLPQNEFSLTSTWMAYSLTGSSPIPEDLTAKIVGARFENGEDWGEPVPMPPSGEGSTPSPATQSDITPSTVTRSEGVLRMIAIEIVQPVYPALARMARQSGDVVVRITIDENGLVKSAEAISGPPLLQAAAVEAAHQSTFKPTFLAGKAVVVSGTLTFNFHLDEF